MKKKTKKRGLHAKMEDFIRECNACPAGLAAFRKFIKRNPNATLRYFYDNFPLKHIDWMIANIMCADPKYYARHNRFKDATEERLGLSNCEQYNSMDGSIMGSRPDYRRVKLTKAQEKIAREEFERAFPFEFVEKIVRKVLQ